MRAQNKALAVVGAGGHAKVVLSTLELAGVEIGEIFDDDPETWDRTYLGYRVVGSPADLQDKGYVRGILAIGHNLGRKELAKRLSLRWKSVIHPGAQVDRSVRVEAGSVIFAGAVVQPEARVGSHVIVNTSASIDHDCRVGDFCHIAPGARLAGDVRLGEGALIGIGATVAPGVSIGAWATVGAGAVVITDIANEAVVVGVPARPLAQREAP